MSDIIQLLPDHIANQIAAGEVVQRPASAVKELLENAIDAGAKHVRLIVKNAGRTLIQVVDDGIGMSETDARMSFERHATSKIRKAEDLFSVRTMGFRGEALASIAAVAQVELRTKKRKQELGIRIQIEGSEILAQEPCQTAVGTSISIKNLFFNIPARRQFLKSNTVEMRHIIDEFQRVALANPDIFFSLHHNEEKLYHLPQSNMRQRIVNIFGNKMNAKLIPIEEETDIIRIHGYVTKPEAAKKTRGDQFFFVNNRFIRNSYLHHAVMQAYEDLIPKKQYPLYVVFFEIDPSKIDVNIHPTKQEIKFDDERLVYNYLRVTVRHALAQNQVTPTLDFDIESSIAQHFTNPPISRNDQSIKDTFSSKMNPKPSQSSSNRSSGSYSETIPSEKRRQESNLKHWEQLYEGLQDIDIATQDETPIEQELQFTSKQSQIDAPLTEAEEAEEKRKEGTKKHPYQIHQRYVVSPIKSGFLLIDQQAAHRRILYERYLDILGNQATVVQQQLFPQTIQLSPKDMTLLKSILSEIRSIGIDIEPFGTNTFIVRGLPAEFEEVNEQEVIESLLEKYQSNLELKLDIHENIARSLAYQAAIPAGKMLTENEMNQLIDKLFGCEVPHLAPNGKRTFITYSLDEIAKQFG